MLLNPGSDRAHVVPDWDERVPRRIAVLPVLNQTLDLDAPGVFRPIVYQNVLEKGYAAPSPEQIDEELLTMDIREAGQINSLTPQELGELLDVDGLLYTTVLDWSTSYLGVYASITVAARYELVEASTGVRLWVDEDEAKEVMVANVFDRRRLAEEAAKVAAYAALRAYTPFAERVTRDCFKTLPYARTPSATPYPLEESP